MDRKVSPVKKMAYFIALSTALAFVVFGISGNDETKKRHSGPIIGDLGGVPVSIPRPFAHFVEYDSEPHFLEKNEVPAPESQRTFESKIRSFGFEIRYPDMASEEAKTQAEKLKSDISNTMWMRVGISAGENYGSTGDEALERKRERYLDPKRKHYSYSPLPEKTYGLTGYTPSGIDESRRLPISKGGVGADMNDKNIYFFRDENNQISTFIECSNMEHTAARCQHFFNLKPIMKAHVRVNYRKELLENWREIQSSVSQVLIGFHAN